MDILRNNKTGIIRLAELIFANNPDLAPFEAFRRAEVFYEEADKWDTSISRPEKREEYLSSQRPKVRALNEDTTGYYRDVVLAQPALEEPRLTEDSASTVRTSGSFIATFLRAPDDDD